MRILLFAKQILVFWADCLKWSFWRWEKSESLLSNWLTVLAWALGLVGAYGVKGILEGNTMLFGLVLPVAIIAFVIAPAIRWQNEHSRVTLLTQKRLTISWAEPYVDPNRVHFLRLKVENPSALPIADCYGTLISITMLIDTPQGLLPVGPQDPELPTGAFPPEGHRYPWSWTDRSPIDTTISGNNGCEYLYVAADVPHPTNWLTPTETGLAYPRVRVGTFEAVIEVGSFTAEFRATRVRIRFDTDPSHLMPLSIESAG